jgi:hypothetical protein
LTPILVGRRYTNMATAEKKMVAFECDAEVLQCLKERCEEKGLKLGAEITLAIRRHLAYPPPDPELPPLPDSPRARKTGK